MKLSSPKRVLDLNDFLPPDGEDKFELNYSQNDLELDLYYESDDGEERKQSIRFVGAKHFTKGEFPGFSLFTCEDDNDISILDSVVEYERSEFLKKVTGSSPVNELKHFRVFLHSSGIALHVLAHSLELLK